jgi:hypothetical protein
MELLHNDGFSITFSFSDQLLTYMSNDFMKPLLLFILSLLALYIHMPRRILDSMLQRNELKQIT